MVDADPEPTPFLSAGVRALFCGTAHEPGEAPAAPLIGPDGCIDWEAGPLAAHRILAAELAPGTAPHVLTPEQVARCARRPRGLAARAPAALEQLVPTELPPRLARAHELLVSARADGGARAGTTAGCSAGLGALQLVLAELECRVNALFDAGGAGAAAGPPSAQSPSHAKLKEVLRAAHVTAVLPPAVSLALHVLVGPLHGVCLRNLAWHGFLCPADLPGCAPWPSLLLLLVALGLPPAPRAARAPLAAPRAPDAVATASLVELEEALPATAVLCAPVLHAHMVPALLDAVRLARAGERVLALGLVYAVIEVTLRAAFMAANGLEAESGCAQLFVRHTLLEHVLSHAPPPPHLLPRRTAQHALAGETTRSEHQREADAADERSAASPAQQRGVSAATRRGATNRLLASLGEGALSAIYDEFIWLTPPPSPSPPTHGPHLLLRNLLVHGELCDEDVPTEMPARICRLAVGLAVQLSRAGGVGACAADTRFPPVAAECAAQLAAHTPTRHALQRVWQHARALLAPVQPDDRAPDAQPAPVVRVRLSPSCLGTVEYCAACGMPPELCEYGPAPNACVARALGLGQGASSLAQLAAAARAVRCAALHDMSLVSADGRAARAGALDGAKRPAQPQPREAAPPTADTELRFALEAVAARLRTLTRERAHAAAAPAAAPRRWCDAVELGKLAIVGNTLGAMSRVEQLARVRLCALAVQLHTEPAARKLVAAAEAVGLVELTLLGAEVGTLALDERASSTDASQAVATHLQQLLGALGGAVERGEWKAVPPLAAALVGGRAGETEPVSYTHLRAQRD